MDMILKKYIDQILDKKKLFKHLRIAILIGLILNIINQGNQIIYLDFNSIEIFRFTLTFVVPFIVSIYSAATTNGTSKFNDKIKSK